MIGEEADEAWNSGLLYDDDDPEPEPDYDDPMYGSDFDE